MEGSKLITGTPLVEFEDAPHFSEGRKKHALLENYTKGTILKDPLWAPWWGELIDKFKKVFPEYVVEQKIGLDPDWRGHILGSFYRPIMPTEILIRGAVDAVFFNAPRARASFAVAIDWKSGKPRKPDPIGQLALYALFLFCTYSKLETIKCNYIFIDHNRRADQTWQRSGVPMLIKHFTEKINKVNELFKGLTYHPPELIFEKTKNYLCGKWCPATQEHCVHGREL
jgi:hypothetical protein